MIIPKKLIINYFTKRVLRQAESFPLALLSSRMRSMISDLWFCLAVIMPFFFIFMILLFVLQNLIYPDIDCFSMYLFVMMMPWFVLLFIILNKDIASGKSAGKRIFGYKVIDYSSKHEASQIQCMLRNITMVIWPLEALIIAFYPKRRIGDLIANTEIVKSEKQGIETLYEELSSIENISMKLVLFSLLVSILFSAISSIGSILN